MRARLITAAALLLLVPVTAPASAQPDNGVGSEVRTLIASARDPVFPSLVHVEVQTVDKWAGQEIRSTVTGSGTIIDPSGLVLTNAHVTEGGRKFTCTLADRTRVDATLVGEDVWTDLALLRLDPDSGPYEAAQLGDSDAVETGDLVLAMGSPFALDRTVTLGIVSNPGRVFVGGPGGGVEEMYLGWGAQRTGLFTTWIQHDALINPGNSGGPLVSMDGTVIGINTRGGEGNGFATPANIARSVVERLRADGGVSRSWIGVGFMHLERTGFDRGVLIDWADGDGPAYAAGLRAGDLVTAINGVPVTVEFPEQIPPLLRLVASLPVGSPLTIAYERDGTPASVSFPTALLERDVADRASLRRWGLTVSDITPYEARTMLLDTADGAYVESTRSGSPAELAEPALEEGDIIRSVNGEAVASIRDIVRLYNQLDEAGDAPAFVAIGFDRWGSAMVTAIDTAAPDPADPPLDLPKAWLGIDTQPIVPELARHIGVPGGFRVTRVYPGTTAAGTGLAVGDVITAIGDEPTVPTAIEQAGLFGRVIRRMPIGAAVTLRASRGGDTVDIPVTLERGRLRPEEAERARSHDFGLVVRALTFFDRIDLRLDESAQGVIVESVEDGGWAAAGGLAPGDLLVGIDDAKIGSTASFTETIDAVSAERPERVEFRVRRGNRTSLLFVEPEWSPRIEPEENSGP